jgi:excinuclease UvrABC nuclease subunit
MDINLKTFSHRNPDRIITDIFSFDDYLSIPRTPGAYIFASQKDKFLYPNGLSKIIYIGKTTNLRRRIRTHMNVVLEIRNLKKSDRNSYWYYQRHQYVAKYGGKIYYFSIKGLQDAKNLENRLIENFYDRYLALPVGNGAISYRKTNRP